MCDSIKAINTSYRGPTEQYFCTLEPHRGCLHTVKKVCSYPVIRKDQQSNKYAFYRANGAIQRKSALVPPCSILLIGIPLLGINSDKKIIVKLPNVIDKKEHLYFFI